VNGVHHFVRERGGGIAHQRHMIAEFHGEPGCRLHAGIGEQSDNDHMRDTLLLQQEIEVGICEPLGDLAPRLSSTFSTRSKATTPNALEEI
jgi:hypothetical protein